MGKLRIFVFCILSNPDLIYTFLNGKIISPLIHRIQLPIQQLLLQHHQKRFHPHLQRLNWPKKVIFLLSQIPHIEPPKLQKRWPLQTTWYGRYFPSHRNLKTLSRNWVSQGRTQRLRKTTSKLSQLLNSNQGTQWTVSPFGTGKHAFKVRNWKAQPNLPKNVPRTLRNAPEIRSYWPWPWE